MIRGIALFVVFIAGFLAADHAGLIPPEYTRFYLPEKGVLDGMSPSVFTRIQDGVKAFGSKGF
ncbi:MAG: hypothetical protein HKN63_04170 [Rhodobacteraceae bacterium]|nr:hypothetical protein [Paracoccaceae bacterium]